MALLELGTTPELSSLSGVKRKLEFGAVRSGFDPNCPAVARLVPVYDRSAVSDAAGNQIVVMNARVDRVIKGSIDAKTLKILVGIGGCTRVGIGHGIVLGELQNDPQRGLMLKAIEGSNFRTWSKEFEQKQMDIWNAARRDK